MRILIKVYAENTGVIAKIDSLSLLTSQLEGLRIAVRELEKDVAKLEDENSNPLVN